MEEARRKEQDNPGPVQSLRNHLDLETEVSDSDASCSENEAVDYSSEDSAGKTYHKSASKSKIFINITADELIECTSAIAARYNIGVRPQTAMIAAVCNKSGVDLEDLSVSRSTVHRKRYKKIEILGDMIRQEIIETLKGKRLCVHFDGKQVKEIAEDLNITLNVERISVSVTSPDMNDTNDILLGVVQADSSKGQDQALVILNLLEYYDITEQIYAVCCDTTASNTGAFSGAIALLSSTLNVPLLWFLCRRHMLEVHISHFMEALTGEKTKGPRRTLYLRLQKAWPDVKKELNNKESIELIRYDWSKLQVGSPLYITAQNALQYGKRALTLEVFARGDYKQLCELFVYYLGGDVPNLYLHQPGACHEARFMADALYLLTLRMTDKIARIMNEEERTMVETAAFFVSICYAPWFLKCYLADKAPKNDLEAFKDAFNIQDQYPKLGHALLSSMQRHAWYLTEDLIPLALADDDIEEEEKMKILQRLTEFEFPDKFRIGKPELPVICKSTELSDLVGPQSWKILEVAGVSVNEVKEWTNRRAGESLDRFKNFVKKITAVNDCAERNIRLIQDFVSGYKSEDMKQNLMLVARDSRKKMKKEMPKSQLNSI